MRVFAARSGCALLLLLAVLGFEGRAEAQEDEAPPAVATVPGSVGSSGVSSEDAEAELQATWGEKRVIRTLQRRLFTKFARAEFSLFIGIVPNDPFVTYMPIGLRFDYHFNEAFALEVASSFLGCFTGDIGAGDQARGIDQGCLRFQSDLKRELAEQKQDRTQVQSIRLLDQQVMRADVTAMWSPFFGKVAVLDDALVHFDVNLVGGAGFLLTESVAENNREINYNPTFEAVVGAGFKFYFGERYGIRADFRQFIFPKSETSGVATPSEISLGFSVFTD